ncbi:MAG: hypothetical protein Fur0010_22450 [Bdellovibrio sp.]
MKKSALITLLLIMSINSQASTELVRVSTCQKPSGESVIYNEDFKWNETLEQILSRAENLYQANKRLENRAYINDKGEVVLPINVGGVMKDARLTDKFILSVRKHIEEGLKHNYVDAITFSDMGHSHFFVPQEFYDRELDEIPVSDNHIRYEKMLAHEGLKILYHTAEQLKMLDDNKKLLDDRHVQWRFFTRNLVGDNQALGKMEFIHQADHSHNTAHDYQPGYRYWGGGFYISANKDGCFAYEVNGETKYFDINLEGFKSQNTGGEFY